MICADKLAQISAKINNMLLGISSASSLVMVKIKALLYSRYYTAACNLWPGPSRRHSAWVAQRRRSDGEQLTTLRLI